MKQELDNLLCEKYPKIFADRKKSMQESCMFWGFEIDNGWFDIVDTLCANIQHHIDWKRKNRASALRFNRALERAIDGDNSSLIKHFSVMGKISDWGLKEVETATKEKKFREVPKKVEQVVAEQVKEKFGTLRFYYRGGDEMIAGMVTMAESMSGRVCESCGVPAKPTKTGWIKTMCQSCLDSREQRRQKELDEYNARHEDVYQKFKEKK